MYAICEQRATEFLDGYLAFIDSPSSSLHEVKFFERRRKPRLNDSLPVRIWGIDNNDEVLSFDSHLDNISSSGLFLRIPRQLKVSSQISLVVRLINASGA